MSVAYDTFLARKTQLDEASGFAPEYLPDFLFPFQRALTEWAAAKGRAAIFPSSTVYFVADSARPIIEQLKAAA